MTDTMDDHAWRRAVRAAGADPAMIAEVRRLYRLADAEIASHRPACRACGACCDFQRSKHRLYVTTAEVCVVLSAVDPRRPVTGRCPYQLDGLCTIRDARPLGCRVFHCPPTPDDWQGRLYERWLGRIKRVEARFGLPYRYGEWLATLGRLAELPANWPAGEVRGGSNACESGVDSVGGGQ